MEERTVGDYRLLESVGSAPGEIFWRAEQTSVGREVLVHELTDLSRRESFLANARIKASIDHPLIGSVYEALTEDDGHCLVAMEKLAGRTLADRITHKDSLPPIDLAHLLSLLSEAMLHLASRGVATAPLTLDTIHFDEHGVLRLRNIARAGEPAPDAAASQIAHLGKELPPLVPSGSPGATRALTVLAWMRGEEIDRTLTWEEIRTYGKQIESQLVESARPPTPSGRVRKRKSPLPGILIGTSVLVLAAAAGFKFFKQNPIEDAKPVPSLPGDVTIPTGSYPTADGDTRRTPAFRISACEVTIGEYAEFLEMLDLLDPDARDIYDPGDQPADKQGHKPDDWDAMISAAREGGTWNDRPIDLQCPVVNVDWWDAVAYSDWKQGRLPTQQQWFAALREKVDKPEFLKPAPWGPVTSIPIDDKTVNGLYGMAGSVSEWTLQREINPANPVGEKRPLIIGASFLKPDNGALAREWTDDRGTRRPDLGFRIVLPAEN